MDSAPLEVCRTSPVSAACGICGRACSASKLTGAKLSGQKSPQESFSSRPSDTPRGDQDTSPTCNRTAASEPSRIWAEWLDRIKSDKQHYREHFAKGMTGSLTWPTLLGSPFFPLLSAFPSFLFECLFHCSDGHACCCTVGIKMHWTFVTSAGIVCLVLLVFLWTTWQVWYTVRPPAFPHFLLWDLVRTASPFPYIILWLNRCCRAHPWSEDQNNSPSLRYSSAYDPHARFRKVILISCGFCAFSVGLARNRRAILLAQLAGNHARRQKHYWWVFFFLWYGRCRSRLGPDRSWSGKG